MKDKNKTDGHTKLLIDLLEGMFEELYPEDPEVISNLGGWGKILTKINKNITPQPQQIKNNTMKKNVNYKKSIR